MAIFHRSPKPLAPVRAVLALLTALSIPAFATPAGSDEEKFMAENDAAMARMMDGMTVKPSGNIDEDFVAMMIPHHQGAIDMAMSELRYGHNEQLRRIAQEIIVDQLQEIGTMRLAVGQPLPPSDPAPTQATSAEPSLSPPASHGHSTHTH